NSLILALGSRHYPINGGGHSLDTADHGRALGNLDCRSERCSRTATLIGSHSRAALAPTAKGKTGPSLVPGAQWLLKSWQRILAARTLCTNGAENHLVFQDRISGNHQDHPEYLKVSELCRRSAERVISAPQQG